MEELPFVRLTCDVKREPAVSNAIGQLKSWGKCDYYYFRADLLYGNDRLPEDKYLAYKAIDFPMLSTFHLVRLDATDHRPLALVSFDAGNLNKNIPFLVNLELFIDNGFLPFDFNLKFDGPEYISEVDDCAFQECRKEVKLPNQRALVFSNSSVINADTDYFLPLLGSDGSIVYHKFKEAGMRNWVNGVTTTSGVGIKNPIKEPNWPTGNPQIIVYEDQPETANGSFVLQKPDCTFSYAPVMSVNGDEC